MKTKLITPNGIRVWQGYRCQQYQDDSDGFLEKLGQIFIPITAQLMSPMGLRMYYPTIVSQPSDCQTVKLPDEIALVGYSSQQTYHDASHATVAGRAYSSLHQTVFNFTPSTTPASFSDFPIAYADVSQFEWKTPYYFSGEAIDWHSLYVGVLIWTWPDNVSEGKASEDCVSEDKASKDCASEEHALDDPIQHAKDLLNVCHARIGSNNNLFEIITVLQQDYGVLWFASDALRWPENIIQCLSDMKCHLVMQAFHDTTNISPLFSEDDNGIVVSAGQALDVRLST
ncbi:hypothetical protein LRP49_10700 [Enterovibrio sp. ZSDZ35]|uniref:Uncharacterized protein n=1 Tax=Enterovibrio qingdaonensis TaxID=2899818 RepID=A0ABT5QL07_9GAMM|nr:hypothetical protein [Enterovibrio sp. ZSDZ35]MDD1781663.1 hypothetical protein [Enterovibrio sp. ZSDZ35]